LKEALFLAVWLRRQEAELLRTKLLLFAIKGLGEQELYETFSALVTATFPHIKKPSLRKKDKELYDVIEREAKAGPLSVTPISLLSPRLAKRFPKDEFRKKLVERVRSGAARARLRR
jgi:hypothetical protein